MLAGWRRCFKSQGIGQANRRAGAWECSRETVAAMPVWWAVMRLGSQAAGNGTGSPDGLLVAGVWGASGRFGCGLGLAGV